MRRSTRGPMHSIHSSPAQIPIGLPCFPTCRCQYCCISSVAARYWRHASRLELNRRDSFMKRQFTRLVILLLLLSLTPLMAVAAASAKEIETEAKTFLETYNRTY